MMAFRIAWFKVHKPLAFYSAYFSVRAKGFDASCMIKGDAVCLDKIRELHRKDVDKTISAAEKDTQTTLEVCHEFYKRGFIFEPMDVYKSDATKFIVTEKGLIPPFTSMPGIGEQAAAPATTRKNAKRDDFLSGFSEAPWPWRPGPGRLLHGSGHRTFAPRLRCARLAMPRSTISHSSIKTHGFRES